MTPHIDWSSGWHFLCRRNFARFVALCENCKGKKLHDGNEEVRQIIELRRGGIEVRFRIPYVPEICLSDLPRSGSGSSVIVSRSESFSQVEELRVLMVELNVGNYNFIFQTRTLWIQYSQFGRKQFHLVFCNLAKTRKK